MSAPSYPSPYNTEKKSRLVPVVATLAVIALAAYGVSKFFGAAEQQEHQMPPAAVVVQEIAPKDTPLTFEYAGRTAGSREVEIRARVSGILQARTYVEGSEVQKGQLLFRIDPAPFEAALAQAQAVKTQAERDWQRVSALFREKAVSSREYDEARSAHEQANAALRTARINLDYTTVTAPITGVTSKEGLSEGSLVTADSSLLTRVTQLDPLYVEFAYPDSDAMNQRQQIAAGTLALPEDQKLHAEIRFGDGSVHTQEGTIDFTDSIIDARTGTVRARAVLPNPDGAILPGLFVRVVVKGFTQVNAISIPDRAIMQGPQGAFVFVVNPDGTAGIKPVTLGSLLDGVSGQRLISKGLEAGDKVVTEGMIKVRPGAPVSITPAKEQAPEKAVQGSSAPAEAKPEAKQDSSFEELAETHPDDVATETDTTAAAEKE